MLKFKNSIRNFVYFVTKMNLFIAYGVSLVLLIFGFMMLYEVVARYFFNSPTTWSFEFSKMAFGFYMVWGGAYTMICGEHVSMDIFYSKWPPRTKAIIDSITYIFFIIFLTMLIYLVSKDALNSISFNETSNSILSQPLYHWRASLVVGVFLLFLQGIAEFIKKFWFAIFNEELR